MLQFYCRGINENLLLSDYYPLDGIEDVTCSRDIDVLEAQFVEDRLLVPKDRGRVLHASVDTADHRPAVLIDFSKIVF